MADNIGEHGSILRDIINIAAGLPGESVRPEMEGTLKSLFTDIIKAGKKVLQSPMRPETMKEIRERQMMLIEQTDLATMVPGAGTVAAAGKTLGPKALQMGGRFLRRALQRGGVGFRGAQRAKPVRGRVVERLALPDPAALDRAEAVAGRMPYGELVRKELVRSLKGIEGGVKKTKIGGGIPPKKGLVVANIGADGKTYYGKPGDIHFSLSERYGKFIRKSAELKPGEGTWARVGWADETGKFLTREEALKRVPSKFKSSIKGELDALDYAEQIGRK